jgi:hypothetical protein
MRKRKARILMIEKDDPEKELEFEVEFQLSLTTKQRYKRMMKLFRQTLEYVKKYDYPPEIISRK